MIKAINKNKNLIISHASDIDGMGSVILSFITFEGIDHILCEPKDLENVFNDLVSANEYKNYEHIYLTDFAINENVAKIIDSNQNLKEKFMHFDHHIIDDSVKRYNFINSIIENDGVKCCGTSNFYDYLIRVHASLKLNNDFVRGFVESIRSLDTYDWKKDNNLVAKYLSNLFSVLGPVAFIEKFTKELSVNRENPFELDSTSELIGLAVENNIKNYIDGIESKMVVLEFNNYRFGAFISELYRSEVGNYFSRKYIDSLDFILIYDPYRKSFSMRSEKQNINLSKIAKEFSVTGGGHEKAAGFPLDKNTGWLLNKIIESQLNQI